MFFTCHTFTLRRFRVARCPTAATNTPTLLLPAVRVKGFLQVFLAIERVFQFQTGKWGSGLLEGVLYGRGNLCGQRRASADHEFVTVICATA